ncbi:MAG: hypothetical protein HY079_00470 [Elusimicrobia bacterium]|nr:hypothetical protein [Elusimicrobiota bacterium]
MPGPRARRVLLVLLALLTAPPARAWYRTASLQWRYDDIDTRDPSGRTHRNSWYQGYNADLGGNIFHPYAGTFATGGSYSQGADINTAVNQDVSEQRILSYRLSLQPFSANVRRYFSFDPNWAFQSTRNGATSTTPEHAFTNKSWGWTSGLSLPKAPQVSVSRSYNSLRDPDNPAPIDQRYNMMRESAYYSFRGAVVNVSQDRTRTDDLAGHSLVPLDRTQRGSLDYGVGELKRAGIRELTLRSDYLRQTHGDSDAQRTVTNLLSVHSRDFKAAVWTHSWNYWNDSRRDLLGDSTSVTHTAQLLSRRKVRRGSFSNTLSGVAATGQGGASRSAGLAPTLNLSYLGGRLLSATNAQATFGRSASAGSSLSDSAGTRLDWKPRPVLVLFADLRTAGSEPLSGGSGGRRTHRLGLGGGRRFAKGQADLRYDRTDERLFVSGTRSISDQFNLSGSLNPVERLVATAGLNYTTTRADPGTRSTSKNLRGGLDYSFRWGMRLYADATFAETDQYTANAGLSYSLGRTALGVKYTHSEFASATSYSYLSVSLSRSF